jgi:hypothetical protein
MSGGEPLLHPELDALLAHVRRRGAIASLITNGYYMVPDRIKRLNGAGLEYAQISIDNVKPDDISKKSLKVLDKKLEWMAEYADFEVNINSVVGGGIENAEDAPHHCHAPWLGFTSTVGIIHDGAGQLNRLPSNGTSGTVSAALGKRTHADWTSFRPTSPPGKQ